MALENESSCNVATTAELVAFAKLVPSRWFGLNWDPGNAARMWSGRIRTRMGCCRWGGW